MLELYVGALVAYDGGESSYHSDFSSLKSGTKENHLSSNIGEMKYPASDRSFNNIRMEPLLIADRRKKYHQLIRLFWCRKLHWRRDQFVIKRRSYRYSTSLFSIRSVDADLRQGLVQSIESAVVQRRIEN